MIYLPFFLSEAIDMSGIVAILFCGISARRYISKNVTVEAKECASFVFQLMSNFADTACFCLLGMSIFALTWRLRNMDVIMWTLLLCVIGRAMHVYPILNLANVYRRFSYLKEHYNEIRISSAIMHVVFYSGLRGAVAFACANIYPDNSGVKLVFH
jgi:NhaP-type Na+/H+ or K+/H+ antiporter